MFVIVGLTFYNREGRPIKAKPDFIGNLLLIISVLVLPVKKCDHYKHGTDNDS